MQHDDRDARRLAAGEPGHARAAQGDDDLVDQARVFLKEHLEDQAHGHGRADIGQEGHGLEKALAAQRARLEQAGDQQRAAEHADGRGNPVDEGIAQRVLEHVVAQHHGVVFEPYPLRRAQAVPLKEADGAGPDRRNELEDQEQNEIGADEEIGPFVFAQGFQHCPFLLFAG